jgi:hypothetical protein
LLLRYTGNSTGIYYSIKLSTMADKSKGQDHGQKQRQGTQQPHTGSSGTDSRQTDQDRNTQDIGSQRDQRGQDRSKSDMDKKGSDRSSR